MKIQLSLSRKKDSGGKSELFMRVSLSRNKVFRIKTAFFIESSVWNVKTQKVIIPRLHTQEKIALINLQNQIDDILSRVYDLEYHYPIASIGKSTIIDAISFKDAPESPITSSSFEDIFNSFITLQVKTQKREQQYHSLYHQMERFKIFTKGTFEWSLSITEIDIKNFEDFLRAEPTFFDEEGNPKSQYSYIYNNFPDLRRPSRGENAISNIIKRLRIFFNWCEKTDKLTNSNPFQRYKLRACVYGTPYYIYKDELETLRDFHFTDTILATQRDIFVFQSNVGMRVSDMYALTKKNIVGDYLEYIPSKTISHTGKSVRVPLTTTAKNIIQKYSEEGTLSLLPFIDKHYYNKAIKKMLKIAGITRVITIYNPLTNCNEQKPICEVAASHMARRTFIGNLYNKVKDPNIIGSMTGHSEGSKAFARYRTIGDDLKKDALSALE